MTVWIQNKSSLQRLDGFLTWNIQSYVSVLISLLLAPKKRSLKPCVCSSTSSYTKELSGRVGGTEPTYVETFHLQRKGMSVSFALNGGLREPIWQVTGRDAPRERLSEADSPELDTVRFPAPVFHLLLDSAFRRNSGKNFLNNRLFKTYSWQFSFMEVDGFLLKRVTQHLYRKLSYLLFFFFF